MNRDYLQEALHTLLMVVIGTAGKPMMTMEIKFLMTNVCAMSVLRL
jgi:hypothetical protein